ncbi:MAG: aldo/keto reductase, partial [Magnetococcus sp. DMHC-8]
MKAISVLPSRGCVVTSLPSVLERFCLGTVKLGLPGYGFSSAAVAPAFDSTAFFQQVDELGVYRFDTSPRYGESEARLGACLARRSTAGLTPWISSKIDNLTGGHADTPGEMVASVRRSLARLQVSQLDLCYLHQNGLEIIQDPWVHEGIRLLKERQLIRHAGVSLYSHEECAWAVECGIYDVIQVPVSLFDLGFYNRFIAPGGMPVRFAGRSLLLQGILANRDRVVQEIRQGREILAYLARLDQLAAQGGMSTTELAFRLAFSLPGLD